MIRRALAFQHMDDEPPGLFGRFLAEQGAELDVVMLHRGEAIPSLAPYDFLLVMGGAMALLDFGPPDRPVDIVFSHANSFPACTYKLLFKSLRARCPEALYLLCVVVRIGPHSPSSINRCLNHEEWLSSAILAEFLELSLTSS